MKKLLILLITISLSCININSIDMQNGLKCSNLEDEIDNVVKNLGPKEKNVAKIVDTVVANINKQPNKCQYACNVDAYFNSYPKKNENKVPGKSPSLFNFKPLASKIVFDANFKCSK